MAQSTLADYFLVTKIARPICPAPSIAGYTGIDKRFVLAQENAEDKIAADNSHGTNEDDHKVLSSPKGDSVEDTGSSKDDASELELVEQNQQRSQSDSKIHSNPSVEEVALGLLDRSFSEEKLTSVSVSNLSLSSHIHAPSQVHQTEEPLEKNMNQLPTDSRPEIFAFGCPYFNDDFIDDIGVIFPLQGERLPDGYRALSNTPYGYTGDCNEGVVGSETVYLCLKRSQANPNSAHSKALRQRGFIVDLKLIVGKEKAPIDYEIVKWSCSGLFPANLNSGYISRSVHLAVKRASINQVSLEERYHSLKPIVDVCIINKSRNEPIPLGWECLPNSTSDGNWTGNQMHICIRRSRPRGMLDSAFLPKLCDRVPSSDRQQYPLPLEISLFSAPNGLSFVRRLTTDVPLPEFFSFVLTQDDGSEIYACCLKFYEALDEETTLFLERSFDAYLALMDNCGDPLIDRVVAASKMCSSIRNGCAPSAVDEMSKQTHNGKADENTLLSKSNGSTKGKGADEYRIFSPVLLTILSQHPFTKQFKQFLSLLYQVSISKTSLSIESYVGHLIYGLPMPTPGSKGYRLSFGSGDHAIDFSLPEVTDLPKCSVTFEVLLRCLTPEQIAQVVALCLLEKQVILHSKFVSVLNRVAESIRVLMYPLRWPHVFVPVCPNSLMHVLDAPVPFLVGCHESVVELIDFPIEAWEIDLDHGEIYYCDTLQRASSLPLSELLGTRSGGAAIDPCRPTRSLAQPPTLPSSVLTPFLRGIRSAISDASAVIPSEAFGKGALLSYGAQSPDLAYSMTPVEASTGSIGEKLQLSVRSAAAYAIVQVIGWYKEYLLPPKVARGALGGLKITPTTLSSIFNVEGFLKAAPKNLSEFTTLLTRTMGFTKFVDERTFSTDLSYRFLFFDCLCAEVYPDNVSSSLSLSRGSRITSSFTYRRSLPYALPDLNRRASESFAYSGNIRTVRQAPPLLERVAITMLGQSIDEEAPESNEKMIVYEAGGGETNFERLRERERYEYILRRYRADEKESVCPWQKVYQYEAFPKLSSELLWSFLPVKDYLGSRHTSLGSSMDELNTNVDVSGNRGSFCHPSLSKFGKAEQTTSDRLFLQRATSTPAASFKRIIANAKKGLPIPDQVDAGTCLTEPSCSEIQPVDKREHKQSIDSFASEKNVSTAVSGEGNHYDSVYCTRSRATSLQSTLSSVNLGSFTPNPGDFPSQPFAERSLTYTVKNSDHQEYHVPGAFPNEDIRRCYFAAVRFVEEIHAGKQALSDTLSIKTSGEPRARAFFREVAGAWMCFLTATIAENSHRSDAWCSLALVKALSKVKVLSQDRDFILDEAACRGALACCALAGKGFALDANHLYHALVSHGCKPNAVTYSFFTRALAIRDNTMYQLEYRSKDALHARAIWKRMRNFLLAYAKFLLGCRNEYVDADSHDSLFGNHMPRAWIFVWCEVSCVNCGARLLDENIMNGWKADETQLAIPCTYCAFLVVPRLSFSMFETFEAIDDAMKNNWNWYSRKAVQVEYMNPCSLRIEVEKAIKEFQSLGVTISFDSLYARNVALLVNMIWFCTRLGVGLDAIVPPRNSIFERVVARCTWQRPNHTDLEEIIAHTKVKPTRGSKLKVVNSKTSKVSSEGTIVAHIAGDAKNSAKPTLVKKISDDIDGIDKSVLSIIGEHEVNDTSLGTTLWNNPEVALKVKKLVEYPDLINNDLETAKISAPNLIILKLVKLMMSGDLPLSTRLFLSARLLSRFESKTESLPPGVVEYGPYHVTEGWEMFSNSVYIELYALVRMSDALKKIYASKEMNLESSLRHVLRRMKRENPTLNSLLDSQDFPPHPHAIAFRDFFTPL